MQGRHSPGKKWKIEAAINERALVRPSRLSRTRVQKRWTKKSPLL
jgi:hypothetical protein